MKRRKFLRSSLVAAISIPGFLSLSGCSGGGGGDSTAPATSLSTTDQQVVAISAAQAKNDASNDAISSTSTDLLIGSVSAAPVLAGLMRSSSLAPTTTSAIFSAFTRGNLAVSNAIFTKENAADSYFKLSSWEVKLANHELAYKQTTAQITKLKACLRLYGYEQSTIAKASALQAGALQAPAKSTTADVLLSAFTAAINLFKSGTINSGTINGLTSSITALSATLKEKPISYSLMTLAFNAIEDVLKWIQTKSLSNINFSTDSNIMLSISKMAVASISVLGIIELENLKAPINAAPSRATALTEDEQAELTAFLEGTKLQSQLILTLTAFVDGIMKNIVTSTTARANELISELNNTNTVNFDPANDPIVGSLRQQSFVLAALGVVMKVLVDFYNAGSNSTEVLGSDAQDYALLFTDPISAYDTIFSGFTKLNASAIFSSSTIQDILGTLTSLHPDLQATNVTATSTEVDANAEIESEVLITASTIATPGLDLATQAANFTTHMADLAYQFTMKIENDAYTFAMQGMEYGYLFASRGEEVGLMADRILWMAVQIGQMADRIGEMADRIVYTEQLIVYTEMLILDFGLLIYGGMKEITNLMLMGMAIVFDREWYAPSQSDPIVTVISEMTQQMLADMHVYQLAVLENQNTLRETTLGALDWIQGEY